MCNDNRVQGERRLEEKSLQVDILKGAQKNDTRIVRNKVPNVLMV